MDEVEFLKLELDNVFYQGFELFPQHRGLAGTQEEVQRSEENVADKLLQEEAWHENSGYSDPCKLPKYISNFKVYT